MVLIRGKLWGMRDGFLQKQVEELAGVAGPRQRGRSRGLGCRARARDRSPFVMGEWAAEMEKWRRCWR